MKKQKKQFLILLVLLFVIVGGGLGALKYIEYQEQKEAEKIAAETIYITSLIQTKLRVLFAGIKQEMDGMSENLLKKTKNGLQ